MNDMVLRIQDPWEEGDALYQVVFRHQNLSKLSWQIFISVHHDKDLLVQASVSSESLNVKTGEASMCLPLLITNLRLVLERLLFLDHVAKEALACVEAPKETDARSTELPGNARITNSYVERILASDPDVMVARRNVQSLEYLIGVLEGFVGKEPNTGTLEMAHYGYLGRKANERAMARR